MQLVQYQLGKKIKKCHTTQLPVATTVPSVIFFVLSDEVKELKKCRSLVEANCSTSDSTLSASTREPTLQTLKTLPSTVGKFFHCYSLFN